MSWFKTKSEAPVYGATEPPFTPRVERTAVIRRERGAVISMAKTGQGTISMRKGAEAAHERLTAAGLLGIRGIGRLWIDRSGSMEDDFDGGSVQTLAEMTLAYMFQFVASVEVRFWDSRVYKPFVLTMDNYRGAIAREHAKLGGNDTMGGTNMAAMMTALRDLLRKGDPELSFDVVLTDGRPNDYREDYRAKEGDMPGDAPQTTEIVCSLAGYPTFLKFVGVRDTVYLTVLDDLESYRPGWRLLDNVDTKIYPGGLDSITPEQFSADMADEWASWIAAATTAGVLRESA